MLGDDMLGLLDALGDALEPPVALPAEPGPAELATLALAVESSRQVIEEGLDPLLVTLGDALLHEELPSGPTLDEFARLHRHVDSEFTSRPPGRMRRRRPGPRMFAALSAAALLTMAGTAAAATGSLPAPIQALAHDVGLPVPAPGGGDAQPEPAKPLPPGAPGGELTTNSGPAPKSQTSQPLSSVEAGLPATSATPDATTTTTAEPSPAPPAAPNPEAAPPAQPAAASPDAPPPDAPPPDPVTATTSPDPTPVDPAPTADPAAQPGAEARPAPGPLNS